MGASSLVAVRRLLIAVTSLAAEHRLWSVNSGVVHELSCPARGMWDLPGPGIEPVSPALASRSLTTGPPEKKVARWFLIHEVHSFISLSIHAVLQDRCCTHTNVKHCDLEGVISSLLKRVALRGGLNLKPDWLAFKSFLLPCLLLTHGEE